MDQIGGKKGDMSVQFVGTPQQQSPGNSKIDRRREKLRTKTKIRLLVFI